MYLSAGGPATSSGPVRGGHRGEEGVGGQLAVVLGLRGLLQIPRPSAGEQ